MVKSELISNFVGNFIDLASSFIITAKLLNSAAKFFLSTLILIIPLISTKSFGKYCLK